MYIYELEGKLIKKDKKKEKRKRKKNLTINMWLFVLEHNSNT